MRTRGGRHGRHGIAQRLLGALLFVSLWWGLPAWADDGADQVLVVDPYLELHTGPGRGYPIFYVAERGEWVEILKRHTDWFKVRTARGKKGWVSREQMENTLTEAGSKRTFRDALLDDYLRRRLEFGFSYGQFENDPIITAFAGYRLQEHLTVEFALGQSAGTFSSTQLIYASLISQPFPDSRWSPFLGIGFGYFENRPKTTLVNAVNVDSDLATMSLGMRYYVTRRFFIRGEFKDHVALLNHNRTEAYQEYSLGVAFFF